MDGTYTYDEHVSNLARAALASGNQNVLLRVVLDYGGSVFWGINRDVYAAMGALDARSAFVALRKFNCPLSCTGGGFSLLKERLFDADIALLDTPEDRKILLAIALYADCEEKRAMAFDRIKSDKRLMKLIVGWIDCRIHTKAVEYAGFLVLHWDTFGIHGPILAEDTCEKARKALVNPIAGDGMLVNPAAKLKRLTPVPGYAIKKPETRLKH